MSNYKSYMIVDATQLDEDLGRIADAIRAKNGDTKEYNFPEDYETAIGQLYYDSVPNSVSDLSVNGPTVTVEAGFYRNPVSTSVASGSVQVNELSIQSTPTVQLSGDNTKVVSNFNGSMATTTTVREGYVTASNVSQTTVQAYGAKEIALNELLAPIVKTSANVTNTNGVIKVAKGYYPTDVTHDLTLQDDRSITDNGDGTITIPAGYYSSAITYTLPSAPAEG